MKVLIAAVGVLAIVAGGVWMIRGGDDQVTNANSAETKTGVGEVENAGQPDVTPADEGKPASEAATAVETEFDAAESSDTQAVVEETEAASPFATIDEPLDVAEPQIIEPTYSGNSESVSSVNDATSTDQSALDSTQRGNGVVPQSYPVTDAAKYFIPKEERGPGNLGGPPPLDFPGGPSDPNSSGSGNIFTPPTAPGN